jgi:F420-dependent oxidoreductase-like protein
MDLGIHIANYNSPRRDDSVGEAVAALASTAEAVGCDSVAVMDHFFQMEDVYPVEQRMLESYTTLGFLAARTSRVQLRALVTGVTYRSPGLLAKIVTTLDVLSKGRAELGIGAAWYEREHRGLGVAFPPIAERFERLEETLQICLQMWSDNDGPYQGRHYQLTETLCSPQPISQPHPAIMIGGGGEKKTLRLVARYADACNLFTPSVEEVARKLEVLRGHCRDQGRDYAAIRKTILYTGEALGEPERFVEQMREYHDLGVEGVIVMPSGIDQIRRLGDDVIPRLNEL